jgi:AcrR family transcriptional regulator
MILSVARKKFLRHGFNRVSIDSIVRDLHTSKSTIYAYFETKEDLIIAVLDQLNCEINENLEKIISNRELMFNQKLIAVIEYTRRNLALVDEEFLHDLKYYTPNIWEHYEKARTDRINTYHRQLFIRGVEDRIIRDDIDIDVLLNVYLQLTEMTVDADHFNKLDYTNQDLYAGISRVFLEGALVRDPQV